MSELARQQQALLAALLAWPADEASRALAAEVCQPWSRGLMAYQANGHALAVRALAASHPVLEQLLGPESFAALARAFWHAQPPLKGDVSQWGDVLPGFLAGSPQLQDEPYLADVARVEWALHRCASAADAHADTATFQRLLADDPAQLTLVLAPGCALVRSSWPVASIMTAHQDGNPTFEEVGQRLRAGVAETALIWRAGMHARVRLARPGEAELIVALLAGQSLGAALEGAADLDFTAWLPMAVQTGLLLAVQPLDALPAESSGDLP